MINRSFPVEDIYHYCHCAPKFRRLISQYNAQRVEALYFDVESRLIRFDGKDYTLSYFQAEALWVLLINCDNLVEIGTLMNALYGGKEERDVQTLRKHMRSLDSRLCHIGVHGLIKKLSNRGYIACAYVLSCDPDEPRF